MSATRGLTEQLNEERRRVDFDSYSLRHCGTYSVFRRR